MILAIDPGLDTGYAFIHRGVLNHCGMIHAGEQLPAPHQATSAVLEVPWHRPGSGVSPNNLITLALTAGRYVEQCARVGLTVEAVFPHKWKGSIPKAIHHPRVMRLMSAAEIAIFEECTKKVPKGKRHNVLDAVALGLWKAGRS